MCAATPNACGILILKEKTVGVSRVTLHSILYRLFTPFVHFSQFIVHSSSSHLHRKVAFQRALRFRWRAMPSHTSFYPVHFLQCLMPCVPFRSVSFAYNGTYSTQWVVVSSCFVVNLSVRIVHVDFLKNLKQFKRNILDAKRAVQSNIFVDLAMERFVSIQALSSV